MKRIRLAKAAELVGVHRTTLRRWCHEGIVSYYVVGRGNYIEFEQRDIDALIASMRRERAVPPVA
jgi:excisionase family DNA binding protein